MLVDKRTQRTRSALLDSLTSLMTLHGYRSISIDTLLRQARVARSTFYSHFRGKDDLLRQNVRRLGALAVEERGDLSSAQRLLRFSRAFYAHVYENRRLYLSLSRDPDRGAVVFRQMREVLADIARNEFRKADAQQSPDVVESAVQFFVGAQWSVLAWWLERRPGLDADTVHEHFERLASPVLARLND